MDTNESLERLVRIEAKMENVLNHMDDLVLKAEFLPVKLIAYGLAGGVMSGFLAAVIFNVLDK